MALDARTLIGIGASLQRRNEVRRLREDLRRAGVLGDKVARTER